MTLESNNATVRLSIRDWIAIGAIAITILMSVLASYLHHDRLLVQVATQQQSMSQRLDRIEVNLDRSKP
jgi:heme exporter protein D